MNTSQSLLPLNTMDDTMEISSERGHDFPTEDIDIDLEIMHEHNDDDFMIDDAKLENNGQSAPNDDVMLDDDQASWNMADADEVQQVLDGDMNDADLGGNIELLAEVQQLATSNELPWTEPTAVDVLDTALLEGDVSGIDIPPAVDDQVELEAHVSMPEMPSIEPEQSSVLHEQAIANGESQKQEPVKTKIDQQTKAMAENIIASPEEMSKILVTYQDSEYALFSSSESEDPDTYFLKDVNITSKPLPEFLAALRDIIQDDVAFDEEVCLAVEDLGLEISESTASVESVTFAQIFELYRSLVKNDGVKNPGPLRILLATKPDFMKRLVHLSSAAQEGSGLSEVVTWDNQSDEPEQAQSESREDDDELGQTTREGESNRTGEEQVEHVSPVADEQQPHGSYSNHASNPENEVSTDATAATPIRNNAPTQEATRSAATPDGAQTELNDSGIDEDGDFIDYEEDPEENVTEDVDGSAAQVDAEDQSYPDQDNDAPVEEKFTLLAENEVVDGTDHQDEQAQSGETFDNKLDLSAGANAVDGSDAVEDAVVSGSAFLGPDEGDSHSDHANDELDFEEVFEDDLEGNENPVGSGVNLEEPNPEDADPITDPTGTIEESEIDYLGKDLEAHIPGSTESESTLAADVSYEDTTHPTVGEDKDEIDYEDDEDSQELDLTIEAGEDIASPRPSSSKRPHEEVEAEEAASESSQESKRIRS